MRLIRKPNDSIYDLDINVYFGEGYLMEEMDGLKFKIGPKSFFQTNYKQALELYRKTLEFADLKGMKWFMIYIQEQEQLHNMWQEMQNR
jgi:tRNA/tmRNA/rRNA uracil-C5-methylase (TrmA/RlmC/RlmD family)